MARYDIILIDLNFQRGMVKILLQIMPLLGYTIFNVSDANAQGKTQESSLQYDCESPPIAIAGKSVTICSDSTFHLNGTVLNVIKASWSSNGDGIFVDPTNLKTDYLPGPSDISAEKVLFILTTEDPDGAGPCLSAQDSVLNFIYNRPVIDFKPLNTICQNDNEFIIPVTPQGGTFSGSGIYQNKFFPSKAGLGFHTIYYLTGGGDCRSKDSTVIEVQDCGCDIIVSVSIGEDRYVCPGDTAHLRAELIGANGGKWSSSGSGIFTNPDGLQTLYLPSAADVNRGYANIKFTSEDPDGLGYCKAATDLFKLAFLVKPTFKHTIFAYANCRDSITRLAIDFQPNIYGLYGRVNGDYTSIGNYEQRWVGVYTPTDFLLEIYYLDFDCPVLWKDSLHIRFPERSVEWEILDKNCELENRGVRLIDTNNLIMPLNIKINHTNEINVNELPFLITGVNEGQNYFEIMDAGDCIIYDTIQIQYDPLPTITMDTAQLKIYSGQSISLNPLVSSNVISYLWSPTIGLSCTNCLSPIASPNQTTIYHLIVTDKNGCTATADREVIVLPESGVYFPNVITPDHNGINDYFTAFTGYSIEHIISMKIFNRWGSIIFENHNFKPNDENAGWNGTYKGKLVDPGTYIYIIQLEIPGKGLQNFKGNVTILR